MKKLICCVLLLMLVMFVALILPQNKNYDYLRVHIRANSNSQIDQAVKYKVKDSIVDYLTPKLCKIKTKQQAVDVVESEKSNLEQIGKTVLRSNGLDYNVNVKIDNEYFPTRSYNNTTLESGYYDAVIVELGDAIGDNWWCVMYPPLCFVDNGSGENIKFVSRIKNFFAKIF